MKFLRSYGIALLIIAAVGVWMAQGVIVQGGQGPDDGVRPVIPGSGAAEHHEEAEGADPHLSIAERNAQTVAANGSVRSVRIQNFTVQPMPLEITLRGRTEAKSVVSAAAETSGIVDAVHVTKGQKVAAGDLLCTLDEGTRAASLAQAEAQLAKAQLDFDTNSQLREKGFAAENSAAQLEATLKAATAAVDQARAELERTEIHAKTSGIVQGPIASAGQMLSVGGACATIVQLDPIVFTAAVPEARIGLAREGLPVTVETISGETVEGTVTYISATADDATRSFPVEVEAPNADGSIRDGITAEGTVKMGLLPAHLLPQSSLTLNDEGTLGVRAVDNSVVVFHTVEIVKDTREGVWVTGLPSQVAVITLGQEEVREGQTVDAREATTEEASI